MKVSRSWFFSIAPMIINPWHSLKKKWPNNYSMNEVRFSRRVSRWTNRWSVFAASINCLHADGAQFAHPLQHLGKSQADLPLLAIDSFRHMFLFPDINDISLVILSSHSSLIILGRLLGKMASCYNSLKIFIPKNFIKTFIIPRRPRRRAPPFLLPRFVSERRKREIRMFCCS